MAGNCVQQKCNTRNDLPNIQKHEFANLTYFYINL